MDKKISNVILRIIKKVNFKIIFNNINKLHFNILNSSSKYELII